MTDCSPHNESKSRVMFISGDQNALQCCMTGQELIMAISNLMPLIIKRTTWMYFFFGKLLNIDNIYYRNKNHCTT